MITFQYNVMDKSKHTLQILEKDDSGSYEAIIDGKHCMIDNGFLHSIIVIKNEGDDGQATKSMILG